MKLEGKVATVTGAAQGIGRAIAFAMAMEGSDVVIGDLNLSGAEDVAASICALGRKALALQIDVSKPDQAHKLVATTVDKFKKLDVLVNNAGICPRVQIDEVTEEIWDKVIDVNLKGTFFCSQAAARVMKVQRFGRIINLSSVSARTGGAISASVYAASKAGIIALTKAFAKDLAPYNVNVNAIAPGAVDTELVRVLPEEQIREITRQIPIGRLALPEEIANVAVFLASEDASYVTGATIDVNGGWFMY